MTREERDRKYDYERDVKADEERAMRAVAKLHARVGKVGRVFWRRFAKTINNKQHRCRTMGARWRLIELINALPNI